MSILDAKLRTANVMYWGMKLYRIAFDFIIGFMAAAIAFTIAGVSLLFALIPAAAYAIYQVFVQYRRASIVDTLRHGYGGLDESLQTAIEHRGTNNIIVDSLVLDVTKKMDDVETSSFLESKELSKRVYTLVALSFILLTTTVLDLRGIAFNSVDYLLDFTDLRQAFDEKGQDGFGFETLGGNRWDQSNWTDENDDKLGAESGGERPGVAEGPLPGTGGGVGEDNLQDIYGKASSASIQGDDVDFRLHPEYGGDIEIRETGGSSRRNTFQLEQVQSAEECEECVIGPEHEEMVRRYFEKILPET